MCTDDILIANTSRLFAWGVAKESVSSKSCSKQICIFSWEKEPVETYNTKNIIPGLSQPRLGEHPACWQVGSERAPFVQAIRICTHCMFKQAFLVRPPEESWRVMFPGPLSWRQGHMNKLFQMLHPCCCLGLLPKSYTWLLFILEALTLRC